MHSTDELDTRAAYLAGQRDWRRIQAALDAELGTDAVEEAMRRLHPDPDADTAPCLCGEPRGGRDHCPDPDCFTNTPFRED